MFLRLNMCLKLFSENFTVKKFYRLHSFQNSFKFHAPNKNDILHHAKLPPWCQSYPQLLAPAAGAKHCHASTTTARRRNQNFVILCKLEYFPRFSNKQNSEYLSTVQLYKAVIYIIKISARFLRQNNLFTALNFAHFFLKDGLPKKMSCK